MTDNLESVYRAIYDDPAHVTYGRGLERCQDFLPRLWRSGIQSVLALGCGHGDELVALSGRVENCDGVDFALPPKTWYWFSDRRLQRVKADITTALNIFAWTRDAVVSFDVLEHLSGPDGDTVIRESARIAPLQFHAISNMSDTHIVNGKRVELHLSRWSPEVWKALFEELTGKRVEVQQVNKDRFGVWVGEWPA